MEGPTNSLKEEFAEKGWRDQTRREAAELLTGSQAIALTADQNAIEADIIKQCAGELDDLDAEYREKVEAPIGYIRAANIDLDAPRTHLAAAESDLEQARIDGIRQYHRAVDEEHRIAAEIRAYEVAEDLDASDVGARKSAIRKSIVLGGGEFVLNTVNFASGGQLAAGLLGGGGASALLSVFNAGGGAFAGVVTKNISSRYKHLFNVGMFSAVAAINVAAVAFRTGGELHIDFPSMAMASVGVGIYAFNRLTWKKVPSVSHRLAELYRQKGPARDHSESVYQAALRDMYGVRGAAVEAIEEGVNGDGLTVTINERISDLNSAIAFIENEEDRYRESYIRILNRHVALLVEHRAQLRDTVGRDLPLPQYFHETPDLCTKFGAIDVRVSDLQSLVEKLIQDGRSVLQDVQRVIVEIDKALADTCLAFRQEAKKIARTPQYAVLDEDININPSPA